MIVVTPAEMRELDRLTIEKYGVPGETLMERAGQMTSEVLLREFPQVRKGRVLVLVGKGNNGGDGLVVARRLLEGGIPADVLLLASGEDFRGDARTNLERFRSMGGEVGEQREEGRLALVRDRMEGATLVVDAILGTGLNEPVRGTLAEIIALTNASGVPLLAVDVPSGLHCELGVPFDVSMQAEVTVTFGYAKLGQTIFPGVDLCGDLVVADIGISEDALREVQPRRQLLDREGVGPFFSGRSGDAHKGSFGHLLILAGSRGKTGAAVLTARAATRVGAGLVTLAVPRTLQGIVASQLVEVMTEGLPDDGEGFFSPSSSEVLEGLTAGKDAVVIGPGIGLGDGSARLVRWLLEEAKAPVLYDADALNLIAGEIKQSSLDRVFRSREAGRILTPHPGEMSRLVGRNVAEVQRRRVPVAEGFAQESGSVVVLKGARTLIASPDGRLSINPTGNPGMASGGMGDALSGVIGGLMAQGLPTEEAGEVGAYLHGAAGDRVREHKGEFGMLASDVIEALPETALMLGEACRT
jgi:NAD(P)H-hydrate epimerase